MKANFNFTTFYFNKIKAWFTEIRHLRTNISAHNICALDDICVSDTFIWHEIQVHVHGLFIRFHKGARIAAIFFRLRCSLLLLFVSLNYLSALRSQRLLNLTKATPCLHVCMCVYVCKQDMRHFVRSWRTIQRRLCEGALKCWMWKCF